MLPETKIYNILADSDMLLRLMNNLSERTDDNDNHIYTGAIPDNINIRDSLPIIRINYLSSVYKSADNHSPFKHVRVQVSWWTKTLSDCARMQETITRELEFNGWNAYDDGHQLDPDTAENVENQLYMGYVRVHGLVM